MAAIGLDRLLKQRSALRKPDFSFESLGGFKAAAAAAASQCFFTFQAASMSSAVKGAGTTPSEA